MGTTYVSEFDTAPMVFRTGKSCDVQQITAGVALGVLEGGQVGNAEGSLSDISLAHPNYEDAQQLKVHEEKLAGASEV